MWFLWWLRHGAIGPLEATPLWVNVDRLDFWIRTFNLVIRLSNGKQPALRFCTIFWRPAAPVVLLIPWNLHSSAVKLFGTIWNLLFHRSLWRLTTRHLHLHDEASGMSFSCRCGLFGFWWGEAFCAPNSLGPGSCFMPLWLTGTRAWIGTTHDL